jgi:hypothetical protein
MTHAESQDLLVDLAYGELDARRAAEVEEHLSGCAECRAERAALEEARRLSAPLRELEEPAAGFDERILEAARAEAHHQHDGNVGQVIEVAGNVRPLGLEAARIDAHGPVKARASERKRPRWMVRAALGGSVAAAAALALVVSTTLDARRPAAKVSQVRSEDYRIRVKPAAPEAVDPALRDAEARREVDGATAKEQPAAAPPPAAPAPVAQKKKLEPLAQRTTAEKLPAKGERERADKDKQDGALDAVAGEAKAPSAPPPSGNVVAAGRGLSGGVASASGEERTAPAQPQEMPVAARQSAGAPAAQALSAPAAAPPRAALAESREMKAAAATRPKAAGIEASAQQARHAADYVLAASLYRSAAEARQEEGDASAAAWNLAHAVECLAAVGRFDEARQVREELTRLHPSETTAIAAARRALREVEPPPDPAPTDKQK